MEGRLCARTLTGIFFSQQAKVLEFLQPKSSQLLSNLKFFRALSVHIFQSSTHTVLILHSF